MVINKLRKLRETSGLTQQQVAISLGVDTAMISKIEHGTKSFSKTYISKFSELYGVSIETLEIIWLAAKIERFTVNENCKEEAILMLLEDLKSESDGNK